MPSASRDIGADARRRITHLADTVQRSSVDVLMAAALAAKRRHEQVIASDSGGDSRLSGVGRVRGRPGNAKVGVRFDRDRTSQPGRPAVIVKATGPLHIINNDMSPHFVTSAYAKGSRKMRGNLAEHGLNSGGGRRAVINIPGVGFRRWANHPGTRGKKTWQKGRTRAEPDVQKQMRKRTRTVIARGMRG